MNRSVIQATALYKAILAELEKHDTKCLDNGEEREAVAVEVFVTVMQEILGICRT